MEMLEDNAQMSSFLKKVQQLRGYGDMDSYVLVKELKKIANLSKENLDEIIEDFSAPKTWILGKMKLINDIEALISHT